MPAWWPVAGMWVAGALLFAALASSIAIELFFRLKKGGYRR